MNPDWKNELIYSKEQLITAHKIQTSGPTCHTPCAHFCPCSGSHGCVANITADIRDVAATYIGFFENTI